MRTDLDDCDTALIDLYISAARSEAEAYQWRKFVVGQYRLDIDRFPGDIGRVWPWRTLRTRASLWGELPIYYGPVVSVDSIAYTDENGDPQTWAASKYQVDTSSEPARISPVEGETWPNTQLDTVNAVQVTYTAGYLAPISSVDSANDTITVTGRTFAEAEKVRLSNSGGTLPAPLETITDYYAVGVSGSTFGLETSVGGGALDLEDNNAGQSFVGVLPANCRLGMLQLMASYDEHREAVILEKESPRIVPLAAETLLMQNSAKVFLP